MTREINLHLVSDSTGGTLHGVVKACIAQFSEVLPVEHLWNLVREKRQIDNLMKSVAEMPGPVLFTLVDDALAHYLQEKCREAGIPAIPVLQPIMNSLSEYLGLKSRSMPGLQHILNEDYFSRIDAMDYALHHDDGQRTGRSLAEADVVLLGVSRTSKTPTCLYLANRGVKAANIPLVPGIALPPEVFDLKTPLFVGLTESPARLVELRTNRLQHIGENSQTDYLEIGKVKEEVAQARQLYTRMGWPVIDVTRRSVEETAAEILTLLSRKRELEEEARAKKAAQRAAPQEQQSQS
ncbi:MAG: kinase/pyrophosphorylase [Alphaproteobacteria bacterium]|nr:MAG: kinase/pyrophosphorylase [Alphaproteobacteria bacterium]